MASKRRNMFQKNKTQETTENGGVTFHESSVRVTSSLVLSEVEVKEKFDYPKTEAEKRELVKKVLTAFLKRPGAWSRLSQVLPIVRIMSAPQRLALASLIMAQVLAGG
ncbi:hypothetical protein AAG570_010992 [Ranatra chinensis]|uniref:Neurotrophin 1 N-terminal domain-containing protein n=1 Tax=Ranatra chinensis TaxID=642074 RepID=A0ABD0YJC0_9HEMI